MKSFINRLALLFCAIFIGLSFYNNSSGSFSSDLTGSPLSSSTCQNGCHNTYALNSGSGGVNMTVPSSYYPGSSYSVSLSISQSTPTPQQYGFMAGVLRDNNANGGTFTAGSGSATTTIGGRSYIKHNSSFNSSGNWSFTWTAPSFTDTISFYFVGNAANNASGNQGDYIYSNSTTIYPLPIISFSTDTTSAGCFGTCDGGISITNVTGGNGGPYTIDWSNNSTNFTLTSLCAGQYTATITDNDGNEEVTTIAVGSDSEILANFNAVPATCVSGDGQISVNPTGGAGDYSYEWHTGSFDSIIQPAQVGTYTITITDGNGCSKVASAQVGEAVSGLVAEFDADVENCDQMNGEIRIEMLVGNPPFAYAWNTGSTSDEIEDLDAGIYTVTVTDSAGCTEVFRDTIINRFAVIDSISTSVSNSSCANIPNGTIDIEMLDGEAPFQYAWSHGAMVSNPFGLRGTTYTVTVTDDEGCTTEETFELTEPDSLVIQTTVDSANEGFCDGLITTEVSGGYDPYYYAWSFDETWMANAAFDLCLGTYFVTVSDDTGCIADTNAFVGTVTGIEESNQGRFSIYPNPARDQLNLTGDLAQIESITLFDAKGQQRQIWEEGITQMLDVKNIPTGQYSLFIYTNEGLVIKPMIISR